MDGFCDFGNLNYSNFVRFPNLKCKTLESYFWQNSSKTWLHVIMEFVTKYLFPVEIYPPWTFVTC